MDRNATYHSGDDPRVPLNAISDVLILAAVLMAHRGGYFGTPHGVGDGVERDAVSLSVEGRTWKKDLRAHDPHEVHRGVERRKDLRVIFIGQADGRRWRSRRDLCTPPPCPG